MRPRILLALIFAANIAVGCSTHRTVGNDVTYNDRPGRSVTVERETTTTENGTADEGALSGTVNGVGEVISLPFRAVGGLLQAIF
ncbi:MAG: hypothetical protein ACTHMB_26650 [Candidatus Binatia bacterium]